MSKGKYNNVYSYTRPATTNKPLNMDLANALLGNKGEVKIEDLTSDKEVCLSMFRDGLWEARRNDIGRFVFCKEKVSIPYLKTDGEKSFEFSLPLIPVGILLDIVEFFRLVMSKFSGAEAMIQIWWNKSENRYDLYVPVQKVAGATVKFEHSKILQENQDLVWVVDIHSH